MTDETRAMKRGTSSDKTLSVMDLFTPDHPEWTVEDACRVLGQSESTVYRYFRSLAEVGLILSIRPGRYLLGPGIVHYDRQLRISDPLLLAAEPALLEIAGELPGPGKLFISRLYRDRVMAMHEHRLGAMPFPDGTFARGKLAPLFSGAPGYAILAFLEVRTARALLRKSQDGASDWLAIKRRMRAVRAAGFAIDIDVPDPGTTYVSVPLKKEGGGVAGSLSIALESGSHDTAAVHAIGARLVDASAKLAQRVLISASA